MPARRPWRVTVSARLIVSLSGIAPGTMHRCAEFAEELGERGIALSLLIAPRMALTHSSVTRWILRRQFGGDALVLHGYDHNAEQRWHRHWHGAEFAVLPAHEAGLRLRAAVALLDRAGLATTCFVPPRWVGSAGTLTALRRYGFTTTADVAGVRDLRTGVLRPGRVHGFGRSEATDPWWCWAFVLGAGRAARRGGLIRLAVDAQDLTRPGPTQAIRDAVDLALHHGAVPATYAGLFPASRSVASPAVRTRMSVPSGPSRSNQA